MAEAQALSESSGDTNVSASNEETIFRETYGMLVDKRLKLTKGGAKEILAAVEEKRLGNKCYVKKEFKDALLHYSKGILKCPQNSDIAREILCKLIGNRTAVNVELQRYKEVLSDIAYLTDVGNYPARLKYRMLWREALCYEALGDPKANETFDKAIKSLTEESNLKDKELEEQIKVIQDHRKNKIGNVCKPSTSKSEIVPKIELKFEGSEKYPAASPLIDFGYDENQGRYALAKEDIPIGTLIVKEEPFVAALDEDRGLTHCQYCFAFVEQLVACATCTNVVFCSTDCMNNAKKSFHGPECTIYATLINRFDIMLVLRIITQRGFSYFAEQKEKLLGHLESDYQGLTKKDVYRSDDYDNVLFLYRKIGSMEEERPYFEAAVYILRVLKATRFFPFPTKQNILLDEELFIGRLILRHCAVMAYNIHGINELSFLEFDNDAEDQHFLNEGIAVGLYPTLALFNHSCEASFVRYYDKKQVIVRTIKPIRAGDIVYDNYGPNFLFVPLEKRQRSLKEDYHFQCVCPPCVENWPTARDMELIFVNIPCKTENCDYVFTLSRTSHPKCCDLCDRPLQYSDIKEVTEPITAIFNIAESLFQAKQFDDALEAYKRVLEIKYKYAKQPDIEIIRIQEKMEYIYARHGNIAKQEES